MSVPPFNIRRKPVPLRSVGEQKKEWCSICHDPWNAPNTPLLQAPSRHTQLISTQRLVTVNELDFEKGTSGGCQTCKMICKVLEPFPRPRSGPHSKGRLVEIAVTPPGTDRPPGVAVKISDDLSRVIQCHSPFGLYCTIADDLLNLQGSRYSACPDAPFISQSPLTISTKAIVLGWVNECEAQHTACTSVKISSYPKRILDLQPQQIGSSICLVEHPEVHVRYTALTHCWGQSIFFRTTKANLSDNYSDLAWNNLAKNFQDAVKVTRWLGIRYLWIDALCIVQDDKEDWDRESAKMGDVYANSYITISATRSAAAETGFLQERLGSKKMVDDFLCGFHITRTPLHGFLTSSHNPRSMPDYNTPIFDRGWCYQERLLSRRVLHFSAEEMVFECRTHVRCECAESYKKGIITSSLKTNLAQLNSPLQRLAERSPGVFWTAIVTQYSLKAFTFVEDRLPALSGIAGCMPTSSTGKYIAGIWETDLLRGLCWQVLRRPRPSTQPAAYTAPSFSWASWTGSVNWPLDTTNMQPAFRVIECATEVDGVDPFGRVKAGHLLLEGKLVTVAARWHKLDLGSWVNFQLGPLGQVYHPSLNYQEPLGSSHKPGTRFHKDVFLFLLSHNASPLLPNNSYAVPKHVVLLLDWISEGLQPAYRRIGLMNESFHDSVFQNAKTEKVMIL